MPYAVRLQRPIEAVGVVTGRVVGHHSLDLDVVLPEPGDGALEKAAGGRGDPLVRQDLGVGDARRIVDADVQELPSDAPGAATPVAVDAVPNGNSPGRFRS